MLLTDLGLFFTDLGSLFLNLRQLLAMLLTDVGLLFLDLLAPVAGLAAASPVAFAGEFAVSLPIVLRG